MYEPVELYKRKKNQNVSPSVIKKIPLALNAAFQ